MYDLLVCVFVYVFDCLYVIIFTFLMLTRSLAHPFPTHQPPQMKAAMERRTAISAELQETIVKVQQEETRVREEKMALLTRKEALKAELREELSLIEKQTAKHEATNKAAAAEEARYKAQLEELDEAIAAMTADINENNVSA